MKPMTQQRVDKAEGDWDFAGRVMQLRGTPIYDHVCFYAHGIAEKCLKARLVEADVPVPKAYNLPHLLMLLLPIEPIWHVLEPDLLGLVAFGTSIVYTGKNADKADAQAALCCCRAMCAAARPNLRLPI